MRANPIASSLSRGKENIRVDSWFSTLWWIVNLCKCQLHLKCISLGTMQKKNSSCHWAQPEYENWFKDDGIYHAVKSYWCINVASISLGIHWATNPLHPHPTPPAPWCSSRSITHWHLPPARAYTDSFRFMVVPGIWSRILLWNVSWGMLKLQRESWEISIDHFF